MKKSTKYGPSLSVGAKHDLRRKLSPEDIKDIKARARGRKHGIVEELAKEYGVHRQTIVYHTNAYANAQMRNKNRKARRDWDPKRDNELKQRRRTIARPRVRVYTREQMREWRRTHPEEAKRQARENSRKHRAKLKAAAKK